MKYIILILFILLSFPGCSSSTNREKIDNVASPLEEVSANEEVAEYLKAFEGRGDLSEDTSKPTPPKEALADFEYPDDLVLDLVLSEPAIHQPVEISFDHRGRLWVVQYNQYPYPEGLKITSFDNHLRVKFDKVPAPPPVGAKGADKITIFEDTNGDGKYDKATDAIEGLNIVTSTTLGRGKIWVLNPPYLLAYPDPDDDGLPNGPPEIHLEGFGLEDTHAVANSLRWGPGGWLYGAQGSTTTANVSSSVSKDVAFKGQAIWRYHPESEVFEIFAEGGGNTFNVEFDEKGRIFSGYNGVGRGPYYKQGAYYNRSLGKHGAFTNPYTFGHLPNMSLDGEKIRFTHALIRYGGGSLPSRYDGRMIAVNPLQSFVQVTNFQAEGSTFDNIDEERILETDDHWFRPVDVRAGPNGAVYLADWYDSRLSHVDPRDTWHKSSGRIYRLQNNNDTTELPAFDLSAYSNEQLIGLLSHENKWFRQQALRQFGDRKDASVISKLIPLFQSANGQLALEALWAINLSGGFNDTVAVAALNHDDPFVRVWGVRLLGDARKVSPVISSQIAQLASREPHPEVRSQLASTAKRLPAPNAIAIIENLLKYPKDASDSDIPLLIWWTLESKVESDKEAVIALFESPELWKEQTVQEVILERLMQRLIMAGGATNFAAAAHLLDLAPSVEQGKVLINGLQEGLRGREVTALPPELVQALQPYQTEFREESLALALRQGQKHAINQVLTVIADEKAGIGERLSYIRIFGEISQPKSIPVLLNIMESGESSGALRQAALQALQRYDKPEIGHRVVKAYPNKLRADPDVRIAALSLLASRGTWTRQLLDAIDGKKQVSTKSIARTISKEDVSDQIVRRLKLLDDSAINQVVERLWPNVQLASSSEKNERMAEITGLLKKETGNPSAGKSIFDNRCGSCHRLFENGGNFGPDLTGYDRSNLNYLLLHIVDPNASIREGYVNYHISTTDGRTLLGVITDRDGGTITLKPFGGEEITLAGNQIKDMQAQKISLMPERLLEDLTDEQIRDLFSYIMKIKKS